MSFKTTLLSSFVGLAFVTASQAALTQIGDANLGATGVDTAGQSRINIELDAVNLAAGTYNVTQFELGVDGTGNVTPLLFVRNGANNGYTVLWVGSDIGVTGAAATVVTTTNYGAGAEQFTLGSATDVYVGAWHDGGALVAWQPGNGTDHDGGVAQTPTSFAVSDTLLDSDISHSGIGRTYMIEASVDVVPEPSSAVLLGLGGLALMLRRRR